MNIESRVTILIGVATAMLVGACGGDLTFSHGELGRLSYSLYTTYEVPQDDLTEARIITGHEQWIDVSLTSKGRAEIENPGSISHRFDPSDGVTVVPPSFDSGYVPSVCFTVTKPGEYTLESVADGEVVDKIELHFETPSSFELSMKVRDPWGNDFNVVTGDPVSVDEGSQIVLLPIPVDADGGRLAGVMSTEVAIDPEWAVTPGCNVLSNTEDVLWGGGGPDNYYFIEPVLVTFTISDPVTGAIESQSFDVQPVVGEQ